MDVPTRVIQSSVNLITSRRLVNLVLGIRKQYAGLLLGVIKKVKSVHTLIMKVILAKSIALPVPHIITKNVLKAQLHVIMMTKMIKRMMTMTKHLKKNLIKGAKIKP